MLSLHNLLGCECDRLSVSEAPLHAYRWVRTYVFAAAVVTERLTWPNELRSVALIVIKVFLSGS